MASEPLLVPLQLQAFLLNPAVCDPEQYAPGVTPPEHPDDHGARIAPITQPNYTFLRLDNFLVQSDVQNHADLHNTNSAIINSRVTDLGQIPPAARRNRYGIYLHWILPRTYRAAVAPQPDINTPVYRQPPTRWIVVRKLNRSTVVPVAAASSFNEYSAWVIESDYRWKDLDSIPLDYDLQVDMSPFVVGTKGEDIDIQQQAEVFIGRKTPLEQWPPDPPQVAPANISLLRSSNQLFADFQMHNSNVFSMLDNFAYGNPAQPQYLEAAQADYYLLGWHGSDKDDPFYHAGDSKTSHDDILKTLFMTLKDSGIPTVTHDWENAPDSTHILCHGAMYDVKWQMKAKPTHVPADDFARRLRAQKAAAVSVGTTPLNAILTYISARLDAKADAGLVKRLEEDIIAIQTLLHARDDGVEGQREAQDMVYNWNFSRRQGGVHYYLAGVDGQSKPKPPDDPSSLSLTQLNQLQLLQEACSRTLEQYRWDMFACWWKYVSGVENKTAADPQTQSYRAQTSEIAQNITKLQNRVDDLQKTIDAHLPAKSPPVSRVNSASTSPQPPPPKRLDQAKTSTLPFYYRARDPTALIGGIDSGWPVDFLELVSCRLPAQVVTAAPGSELTKLLRTFTQAKLFSADLLSAAQRLLSEFQALANPPSGLPTGQVVPQFHDTVGGAGWRDRWNETQPWFPLFFEWEAEYTHIPWEYWSLDELTARLSSHHLVRYGVEVPGGAPLYKALGPEDSHDTRRVSGRSLILPQPSFSLSTKIDQLISDTPADILKKYISPENQEELKTNIGQLAYLSAPLAGLTDQLVTLNQGSHIKPENKTISKGVEDLTAIEAAQFTTAGFTKENLELIRGISAQTPFAGMATFPDTNHCPFKPVTHGQVRFRKFNIIDKFGQTLCGIDPTPSLTPGSMYPCISDFYEPQVIDKTYANTVVEEENAHCEFFQLPPQINQDTRMNATFVKRTFGDPPETLPSSDPSYWRPATDWENPIWGWIVVNYVDYGLQLFLPDGTFYREVRIGGPEGSLTSPKWLPFAPDSSVAGSDPDSKQLDAFISRLNNKDYLSDVWYMLTHALDSLPPAPSAYAEFLNALVGKPLALVNMGWSLEVASPPQVNQSYSAKPDPDRSLLPPSAKAKPETYYTFQVKLGDKDREYDGIVGYFNASGSTAAGDEFDLNSINTYYYSEDTGAHLSPLTTATYPKFTPFWIPPYDSANHPISAPEYTSERNKHMTVFSTIMDPFTAVHAYSSFLPSTPLKLPPWTWEQAMNTMTAFFHAGPITMTQDVPAYSGTPLTTADSKKTPAENVPLPALGAGGWSWLQPYAQAGASLPSFNALGIEATGNILKPGFQKGPYTAVEGYLQLRRPIMADEPPGTTSFT